MYAPIYMEWSSEQLERVLRIVVPDREASVYADVETMTEDTVRAEYNAAKADMIECFALAGKGDFIAMWSLSREALEVYARRLNESYAWFNLMLNVLGVLDVAGVTKLLSVTRTLSPKINRQMDIVGLRTGIVNHVLRMRHADEEQWTTGCTWGLCRDGGASTMDVRD